MTKEEILNGMSEEEFYDMYPDQESWENAQQMKLGGLSGAPHNGQPTADEFFSYGSHVNDELNIPMSNPFYAANGGTPYYGGPIRPYQTGGYKPAPNPDTYFNEQDAELDFPAKGNNVNMDYSKVTKQVPALSQYSTSELNNMGANIPVPNPEQDARFKKIAAYNKEHPYIPAGGGLFKRPDGSSDRFNYTNGAYTPYQNTSSQPLTNNAYGGFMDMGGNTASPMNYGAFNIPMQYGGYEQEYGGVIDPGNNQDYPILEQGGKSALMDIIKAHSKKMRKSYEEGGDTVMQGGNSTDKPTEIRNTFKSVLKRKIQNHMINEQEKAFSNPMMNNGQMDMGGFSGPGMNYNTNNFNETNEQNASLASMYQQRINDNQANLKTDSKNLGEAFGYLGATADPYKKMSVKAKDGVDTGKQRTLSEEEWEWLDKQRKAKENKTDYNRYFGQDKKNNYYYGQGTRGMDYLPMNYNPYTKISKKDDALLRQIAANPSSNIKKYKNINLPFGFGRTKIEFGYKDLYENNMKMKDIPTSLNKNKTTDLGPYPETENEFDFQKEAMLPQYGPRIQKYGGFYQEGGFKSSRLGPQGQTVEMMMNPFNHGNAFANDDEEVSEVANEVASNVPSERYYPETMNPIQAGMPQIPYEDQEVNLSDILKDVPNPARVSYKNTSDDKPKVINKESAVKVKSEAKPVKGVQTPIKKAPAPKTLPVKPKVGSSAPMPGVNSNLNTNKGIPQVFTPPAKKLTQNTVDKRQSPRTGVVVDKKENKAYYIGNKGETGSFSVLTGANVKGNYNPYSVTEAGNNFNFKATPVGYYKLGLPALSDPEAKKRELLEDSGAKGKEGSWMEETMKSYKGKYRDMDPISAFGQAAPVAANLGFHRAFSNDAFNPKDPEFVRRTKLLNSQNPNMRCTTYGCVNAAEASYDEIARVFPTSDTLMVLDSNNPLDAEILRQFKIRAKQKKYGGGLKRYQNPQDGSQVNSDSNNMNPVKMEPINAGPIFNDYVKEQGLKLKAQQEHLKDPSTGSMFVGPEKEASITTKRRPGFDKEAAVATTIAGINKTAGFFENLLENPMNMAQVSNMSIADNAKTVTPANAKNRGNYDINSGMFRPDNMVVAYGGSIYQNGGMQDQASSQQEQIMQGVATMLQQGAQPEQIAQQLVQMGIPQEQVMEIIQTVMQQMEGGEEQTMEQPAMRYGGYAMGGYQEEEEEEDEDYYEDDLDEDEIERLENLGYTVQRY
jgi:hypothetical protein